jgi:hypothetical protein
MSPLTHVSEVPLPVEPATQPGTVPDLPPLDPNEPVPDFPPETVPDPGPAPDPALPPDPDLPLDPDGPVGPDGPIEPEPDPAVG